MSCDAANHAHVVQTKIVANQVCYATDASGAWRWSRVTVEADGASLALAPDSTPRVAFLRLKGGRAEFFVAAPPPGAYLAGTGPGC